MDVEKLGKWTYVVGNFVHKESEDSYPGMASDHCSVDIPCCRHCIDQEPVHQQVDNQSEVVEGELRQGMKVVGQLEKDPSEQRHPRDQPGLEPEPGQRRRAHVPLLPCAGSLLPSSGPSIPSESL